MGTVVLPVTLTANANENVNDLNANLNALTSALNGNVDETNAPNLAAAFTSYKRIALARTGLSTPGAVTQLLQLGTATNNTAFNAATAYAQAHVLYLDPAIFTANARTTKLNLRITLITNAVAPAVNYACALYPVTAFAGAAGAEPFVNTIGAGLAGSTVNFVTPGASSVTSTASGDFNFPAAGSHVIGITPSGAAAANTVIAVIGQLDMRQV